jgi:hypothetical protein
LAYLLTRYRTYTNFRYFLPLCPLVLLAFYASLARRVGSAALRTATFAVVAVLLCVSNFRTVDPISRAVFGSWRFGDHVMLDVTARTHECCGRGRDQLVYNLQFTEIAYLQDLLYERIQPRTDAVLVAEDQAIWYLPGRIDPVTFHRTLAPTAPLDPKLLTVEVLAALHPLPTEITFIAFPNVDNRAALGIVGLAYNVTETFEVERRGYRMTAYRMRLRS